MITFTVAYTDSVYYAKSIEDMNSFCNYYDFAPFEGHNIQSDFPDHPRAKKIEGWEVWEVEAD